MRGFLSNCCNQKNKHKEEDNILSTSKNKQNALDQLGNLQLPFGDFVDTNSGEFYKNYMLISQDSVLSNLMHQEQKEQQRTYLKNRSQYSNVIEQLAYGEFFYFLHYSNLIIQVNSDYAMAFRFLYLCTFANYQSVLTNGKRNMDFDDVMEVLKLSINTFKSFKKKLEIYNLITVDKNRIFINSDYCIKGKINKNYKKNSSRVFNHGIRQIYEQSKASEHKTIGKVIAILPYIHINYNIVCQNPNCKSFEDIKPLSLKDIGNLIGENTKDNNYNRVINKLLKVKVDDKFLFDTVSNRKKLTVVNPKVFYKGNNKDGLQWLNSLFELQLNLSKND